jgi:hypothetical protein
MTEGQKLVDEEAEEDGQDKKNTNTIQWWKNHFNNVFRIFKEI